MMPPRIQWSSVHSVEHTESRAVFLLILLLKDDYENEHFMCLFYLNLYKSEESKLASPFIEMKT